MGRGFPLDLNRDKSSAGALAGRAGDWFRVGREIRPDTSPIAFDAVYLARTAVWTGLQRQAPLRRERHRWTILAG